MKPMTNLVKAICTDVVSSSITRWELEETICTFIYTNWRGKTEKRKVIPLGIRFGSNKWHTKEQYLVKAFDLEKGGDREFAVKDIRDWEKVLLMEKKQCDTL